MMMSGFVGVTSDKIWSWAWCQQDDW